MRHAEAFTVLVNMPRYSADACLPIKKTNKQTQTKKQTNKKLRWKSWWKLSMLKNNGSNAPRSWRRCRNTHFFTTPVNQVTVESLKQEENIQPWISIAGKALASLASYVDFETVFWISKDSFLIQCIKNIKSYHGTSFFPTFPPFWL